MNKNIINGLYIISIGFMLANVVGQIMVGPEYEILFWVGLLVFAFALILQNYNKVNKEE